MLKRRDRRPRRPEFAQEQFKLCGFLNAILLVKSNYKPKPGESVEHSFSIPRPSSESLIIQTRGGASLVPLALPVEHATSEETRNPRGPRKRKRRSFASRGNKSILHSLQILAARNPVQIRGIVLAVSSSVEESRAVVLFDVLLPVMLWSDPQFWKPGVAAAAVLSHLSCDWENRKNLIAGALENMNLSFEHDQRIWNVCGCHVFGCTLHGHLKATDKSSMFDLYEIFKSLPTLDRGGKGYETGIKPAKPTNSSGIWDVPLEVLTSILSKLMPKDLLSIAATCRHLRSLAVSAMPCMNVKLYSHQQVAVEWMLEREKNPQVLAHPFFCDMLTDDGFQYFFNIVTGEVLPGTAPSVSDFKGGMFCDEPGLGKTVTALSLILKTRGKLADPPEGLQVNWCEHSSGEQYGYYEISASKSSAGHTMTMWKRYLTMNALHAQSHLNTDVQDSLVEGGVDSLYSASHSKRRRLATSTPGPASMHVASDTSSLFLSLDTEPHLLTEHRVRCTRSLSQIKRNLLESYEEPYASRNRKKAKKHSKSQASNIYSKNSVKLRPHRSASFVHGGGGKKCPSSTIETNDWVQCDACNKWRKIPAGAELPDDNLAWFCSMNKDVLHQKCDDPQECWDKSSSITYLPGFYSAGSTPGQDQNISFFTSVLKEYASLLTSETRKALTWLANLSANKLSKMETEGVALPPGLTMTSAYREGSQGYRKIFEAFGLVQRKEKKGVTRWYYPTGLDNLVFDVMALRAALNRPVDVVRVYLSRATLIVVPANLVEHWRNQISKHVRGGQVRVFIWTDQRKPPLAPNLAWDYDIVITTFPRLSAEWTPQEASVLLRVHWLRVIVDEGHTLGSSVTLTNKLQMAISLTASCRWLLTGTPTPNTPNSQVSHLQPMLKFLHDEVYGIHSKHWEDGILRPFEAEMEEGRNRLIDLLRRCMISARKADLKTIPPCFRKVVFLDFTEEHAKSYNELVATVRRNILMADWNDPSHVESLLNPKQRKFRITTIRNVRLSCCVAGHIKVKNAGEDIQETMDILTQQGLNPSSEDYAIIKQGLLNGGSCFRCHEWCRLPIITPCMHLLCIDCVSLDSKKCTLPSCGHPYKMQNPEIRARPENPNPKWPVPQDLIELQPSYNQDNWDPDWHATTSSKVAYLVKKLKELQMSSMNMPEKVIIFSQFLEHIHVVEQQLTIAGVKFAGMYSPMHSSNKFKSLMMFQQDKHCMALIMDGSAALGLDLSFVTYVFLMEPIWDRSMEEQVISRAHRMGATRPIHVETLAMRRTIEDQMLEFLQDPTQRRSAVKEDFSIEEQKAHKSLHDFAGSNYLSRLSFVRVKVSN